MGVKTGIEWCDATWNPWVGCTKASEGCANCYMFREQKRYGNDPSVLRQTKPPRRDLPLRKGKHYIQPGSFVFVCSWSDFFHEDVPDEWRDEATTIMGERRDLTYLLLTKRPERLHAWCADWNVLADDYGVPSHIWLGVTAENQERADERIPQLLDIEWPGKKFVSVEPMLGPVELRRWLAIYAHTGAPCCTEKMGYHRLHSGCNCGAPDPKPRLDWVICGGESGPNHRPFDLDWARSLRDQCVEARVPFFLKQYSANKPKHMPLLDGKTWGQRPEASAMLCQDK